LRVSQTDQMTELVPSVANTGDDAWVDIAEPSVIYVSFQVRLPSLFHGALLTDSGDTPYSSRVGQVRG
jgi:hypothetical protein